MSQSDNHYYRLLGARDGLGHALISAKNIRGAITGPGNAYLPPKHHTQKRQRAMEKIAEHDKTIAAIQRQFDEVKEALSSLPQPTT